MGLLVLGIAMLALGVPLVAKPEARLQARSWISSILRGSSWAWAGIACLLVILTYWWIASVGAWTSLPETTHDYELQANALARGQLALLEQPSAAILAISD